MGCRLEVMGCVKFLPFIGHISTAQYSVQIGCYLGNFVLVTNSSKKIRILFSNRSVYTFKNNEKKNLFSLV